MVRETLSDRENPFCCRYWYKKHSDKGKWLNGGHRMDHPRTVRIVQRVAAWGFCHLLASCTEIWGME